MQENTKKVYVHAVIIHDITILITINVQQHTHSRELLPLLQHCSTVCAVAQMGSIMTCVTEKNPQ